MIHGRTWLLAGLAALALAGGVPAPSQAAPSVDPCPGVWVVVDPGDRGDVAIECAESHQTGTDALRSAGFPLELRDAMICRIGSVPGSCTITMTDYWSYWHATRAEDGTLSGWVYSSLGANSYRPRAGDVEGWFFGQGGRVPPEPLPADHRSSASLPATPAAQPNTPTPAPTGAPVDRGSPAGAIAVLGAVVAGAGGLWWWHRRSRR